MSLKGDIEQIMIKELDRISDKATRIMRAESPQRGKNPWTTGALAASVHKETTGRFTRTVGSNLEYAKYVQNGRGPVSPKNYFRYDIFGRRDDEPSLYLKGLGFWMPPGESVGPAPAQHVVEKTIAKLP